VVREGFPFKYSLTFLQEANKAKQQSRENRALQRRLAASFQMEDLGDIIKFNQLKVGICCINKILSVV
jgi:hypothetical protein